MSGIYDFTLAPGGTQRFSVIGNKVKLTQVLNALPLKVRMDGGDAFSCLEGQGARLPDGKCFSDVTLFNPGALTQTGFIFIGDSAFDDTRISGVVSVIDGGLLRTKNAVAFTCATQLPPIPAQYNYIALWNPAATGRRAVIDSLVVGGQGVTTEFISGFMAAGLNGMAFLINPPSKISGGVASVMEIRNLSQVAAISGPSMFVSQANIPGGVVYRPPEPIVVLPGFMFFFRAGLNIAVTCVIDYYEETI